MSYMRFKTGDKIKSIVTGLTCIVKSYVDDDFIKVDILNRFGKIFAEAIFCERNFELVKDDDERIN